MRFCKTLSKDLARAPLLKEGLKSWWVKLARRCFAEREYGRPEWADPAVEVSDEFDRGLTIVTRGYQQEQGLAVDGVIGPQTWGRLASGILVPLTGEAQIRQAVVSHALELERTKIRERKGQNAGEPFDTWNKSAGADPGDPYCVSMWHYELGKVFEALDLKLPLTIGASTSGLARLAKKQGRLRPATGAKPGNLILFKDKRGRYYHTEMVIEVLSPAKVRTVGGNTDAGPGVQGEGNGVFLRERSTHNAETVDLISGLV